MQIVFKEFVDRQVVLNAITTLEGFPVDVINQFKEDETLILNAKDLSPTELSYFLSTLDNSTYLFQADAFIFNIGLLGKDFSLDQSYQRDAVSTERPLTALPTDTPIIARFDIPGFELNSFRELTVRYGSAFDPDELDLLAEIGISVSGNGTYFSITNTIECKVSFYKPAVALENYIINFDGENTIIS